MTLYIKYPKKGGGVSTINATAPLVWNSGTNTLSITQSGAASDGYLSSVDWNTFNNKQASGNYITALTGNVVATGPGSVVATIQAGVIVNSMVSASAAIAYSKLALSNSIVNADINTSAAIAFSKMATLTADRALVSTGGVVTVSATTATEIGYVNGVTSAIQTQLNGKQTSGNYITALTGDGTATGPGSVGLTLATVNSNVGSFGSATQTSTVTVNAKGLVTAASNTSIQIAESQVTNLVSDLAGKQATGNYITALTGDVTAAGPGSSAATLATVNGNVGTFGSATNSATVTVNVKGLVTAASNTAIALPFSQISGTVPLNQGGTGQTTKAAAFDALSPMTAAGDLIIGSTSGTGVKLAPGAVGRVLTMATPTAISWRGAQITQVSGDPANATSTNPIIFPTVGFDTTSGYNNTTGLFTTPYTGFWRMYGALVSSSNSVQLYAYVNSTLTVYAGTTDTSGECQFSTAVQVTAGDTISIRPVGAAFDGTSAVCNCTFEFIGAS